MTKANSHPLPHRAVRTFVWDLDDEGLEDALGRLSDCHFDGLHLGLACHGGRYYTPHNPQHAIVQVPEGSICFQPSLACYERIRPRVHPQYGSGAFVSRIRERARDFGMSTTAWIVLLNNASLAESHPDCVCRNALGDVLAGALCPSNPAVRSYAESLIEDLAHRVGVDAIELEDFSFLPHDAYVGPTWRSAPIGSNLGYLLSLCFCESCRRRAEESNLEADDLSHRVERMIRQALAGDISDRRIGDEIADPYHPVSRYAQVRFETVTSLIDDLLDETQGSGVPLQLILREEPDAIWRWGIEPHILRQRELRATIQSPGTSLASPAIVGRYAEILQLGDNLAAEIALVAPDADHAVASASVMDACIAAGVDRFVFSNYGLATFDMLDWACLTSKP